MSTQSLKEIYQHHKKIQNLESISSLLYWDFETMMPKGSGGLRSEQLSYINTATHNLTTDKSYVEKVMSLDVKTLANPADQQHIAKLQKNLGKSLCVDEAYVQRSTEVSLRCHEQWVKAREAKSFAVVKDDLAELIKLRQEYTQRATDFAALRPYYAGKNAYEILLDDFEPGISADYLRASLKTLVEETVKILPEIEARQKSQNPKLIALGTDQQHQVVLSTAKALGFDFATGRIDKSVHPFCGGHPSDTRITTRYNEADVTDSVWSTIHETGHALYEQGLPKELVGLPCGTAASMGVHESQSRFYENQIGKSHAFCEWIAPHLETDAASLYAVLNKVQKSFLRVESDEVTYNLHIYLRFQLEEKLILGTLSVNDLEAAWNEEYQKTFGLVPASALEGVLQDTHWYGGMFGYFPTYSLGNLLAAELFETYRQQHPNWNEDVKQGNFAPIKAFMNQNVHQLASLNDSPGTMKKILGGKLPDPKTLTNYFRTKFLG